MDKNISEEEPIMVSIRCIAYNHEPYIRQCLEGFVMQKTNFRFEAIVHDDASIDHTADIIREYAEKYPDIIKPIFEVENQYSKRNGSIRKILNNACIGKYVAMCEGDDYWTDPYKLQKQVDFLESNSEYILCSHRYQIYDEVGQTISNDHLTSLFMYNSQGISFSIKENLENWLTKTLTLVYRRNAISEVELDQYEWTRDTHLCYTLLKYGNGFCMPDFMGTYRLHQNGIYSSITQLEKDKSNIAIYQVIYNKNYSDKILHAHIYKMLQKFLYTYIGLPCHKLQVNRQLLGNILFYCNHNGNKYLLVKTIIKQLLIGVKHKII